MKIKSCFEINLTAILIIPVLISFNISYALANPQCEAKLRSGVQWNQKGDTNWKPKYIAQLCNGSINLEAVYCFEQVWRMPGNDWNTGVRVCAGSRDRNDSIAKMHNPQCEAKLKSGVQWNQKGNTNWQPKYIAQLCNGSIGLEAVYCFEQVWRMPGNDWNTGVRVCAGSKDRNASMAQINQR